jgi:hypothetical protein
MGRSSTLPGRRATLRLVGRLIEVQLDSIGLDGDTVTNRGIAGELLIRGAEKLKNRVCEAETRMNGWSAGGEAGAGGKLGTWAEVPGNGGIGEAFGGGPPAPANWPRRLAAKVAEAGRL